MKLEISPRAGADLDEAWLYVAEDSIRAAGTLIDDILAAAQLLVQQPRMGRSREHLAPGLRSLTVDSYIVFYRPMTDHIRIDRVLHGRRDITPDLF